MTLSEEGKKAGSGIVRVRTETKSRLDKLRHPGQSYDGVLEEVLDFWDEHHAGGSLPKPAGQAPSPREKEADKASWWWWPQSQKVPGKGNGG